MSWEQDAAEELGIQWDSRMYCPNKTFGPLNILIQDHTISSSINKSFPKKLFDWVSLRKNYYNWLHSVSDQYDLFLLRYYVHDLFQLNFVKRFKKPVLFVHHSKEVPELGGEGSFTAKSRSFMEDKIGPFVLKNTVGLVGVTEEIVFYELSRMKNTTSDKKPYFIYPNGISYQGNKIIDKRIDHIQILFVCSLFDPWHGLDLLVEDLKINNDDFTIHVVGEVKSQDLIYLESDHRVKLHGKLSNQQINEISYGCHVGLSSFALFRKEMSEACTLKVREYLRLGLPVYAGHKDIFPDDFPFYHFGEPLLNKIIYFAREMAIIPKQVVSESARQYIDKVEILKSLYSHLTTLK
ncbi:hypothetical protein [Endozoicomonas sp. ALB091]